MQAASSISLAGVLPQASTSYLYRTGTCGCNTLFIRSINDESSNNRTESNFPTCTSGRLTFHLEPLVDWRFSMALITRPQRGAKLQGDGSLKITKIPWEYPRRVRILNIHASENKLELHRTCPEGLAFCPLPIQSMDGIFTYVWFVFMVNKGKYTPHGCIGLIITSLTTHNGKFVGKVDNEHSKASNTNKTWVPEKLHHQPQSL